MRYSRYTALAAAMAVFASAPASCSSGSSSTTEAQETTAVTVVEIEEASTTTTVTTTVPLTAESYPDYPVEVPDMENENAWDFYEAEVSALSGGLHVSDELSGYSGFGYVTGFSGDADCSADFIVYAPGNQHYDLSFSIAADEETDCTVTVSGGTQTSFRTAADGSFTEITVRGIYLDKGRADIAITASGDIALDYLKLSDSSALSDITYDADGAPANENAGEAARELLSFLSENYGKYIITGQYAENADNTELDLIYVTTGKYPVIRFTDLSSERGSEDDSFMITEACADWYRRGGISCISWYWNSPSGKSSVYSDESDFSLADAVTDKDIAMLSEEEIRGLYGEGNISEQCYSLILDIDNAASQLTSLKNKGVPVLWRPLPEGSGDWYWWGASGADAYKWLWQLIYTRMTGYFELDNLIWIWNGQSESTLVDKSTFDIAAVDLYINGEKDYGGRFFDSFAAVQKFVGSDKLIAISECGSVPDIDSAFRDNAVWSFFGMWYGEYIMDSSGKYSEEYTSRDNLIRAYNSDGALTLDEYRELTGYKE